MYFFCLQADRPLTGGLISGGGGLLSRGGAGNRLYVVLFTGRWAYNWWGRVISRGALISGGACNRMYFLFTSRWAYNWGACKWRGRGGLYPRGL